MWRAGDLITYNVRQGRKPATERTVIPHLSAPALDAGRTYARFRAKPLSSSRARGPKPRRCLVTPSKPSGDSVARIKEPVSRSATRRHNLAYTSRIIDYGEGISTYYILDRALSENVVPITLTGDVEVAGWGHGAEAAARIRWSDVPPDQLGQLPGVDVSGRKGEGGVRMLRVRGMWAIRMLSLIHI